MQILDRIQSRTDFQALFGQPAILPAHDYFAQILDTDGSVLLCLVAGHIHQAEEKADLFVDRFGRRVLTQAGISKMLDRVLLNLTSILSPRIRWT